MSEHSYLFDKRPDRDRYYIECGDTRQYAENIKDARIRAFKLTKRSRESGKRGVAFIYRRISTKNRGSDFITHAMVQMYDRDYCEYTVMEPWRKQGMAFTTRFYRLFPNGHISQNMGYVQKEKNTRKVKRAKLKEQEEQYEFFHQISPEMSRESWGLSRKAGSPPKRR